MRTNFQSKFPFFWPELPNEMGYFGSYNVEEVAESRVEPEMTWLEVDGDGWKWVHGLATPLCFNNFPL